MVVVAEILGQADSGSFSFAPLSTTNSWAPRSTHIPNSSNLQKQYQIPNTTNLHIQMPETQHHKSSHANARDPNTTKSSRINSRGSISQNLHIQMHNRGLIPQNECSDTKMPDTDSSNLFAHIHKVMMTHYINTQIQTVEWILIEKHTHGYIHSECILIENTYIHTYIHTYILTYLSMKEGSLFCFVVMRSTEPECFKSCSWCFWKALHEEERCMGLVPWSLDLWCKSSWILKWFLHWNLN